MASFCSNCGFPLGANSAFCSRCGTRQSATPASPASAATPPPKSGSGVKILLIALACIMFLGVLGIGAVYYAVHRVKQAVVDKAATYGVDLHATSSYGSPPSVHSYSACSLLSKEEASEAIGIPIAKMEQSGTGTTSKCDYFPAAPGNSDDISRQTERLKKLADQPSSAGKNGQAQDAFSGILKSAMTDPSTPVISVTVDGRDGRSNMTGFAGAYRIMSGITKGSGVTAAEDLHGLGDEAVFGAIGNFMFLKGNTSVECDGPGILGSKQAAIAIARKIAPRL